jgi:uncharacterized protein (TIGR02453 family)
MLQKSTLQFLADLDAHNDRTWFESARPRYESARADFIAFADALRQGLTPLVPQLAEQATRDLLFRIYRDVRFSKNKDPYKPHFSAYFSRAGKKAVDAGYYLHIKPGQSHLSVGMWEPQGAVMKAVRQEIDYSFAELQGLLQKPSFRNAFGDLKGDRLRTLPQGYTADNPAIDILKHKSFMFSHPLPDAFLHRKDAVQKLLGLAKEAAPVIAFLNRAMDDIEA